MMSGMEPRGDPLYALGKLGVALATLVGPAEMKERLLAAGKVLVPVQPRDFPEELRNEYTRMWQSLTRLSEEEPGQGTLHATINAMSVEEAENTAQKILELYMRMENAHG
jgi:hypothetical protein